MKTIVLVLLLTSVCFGQADFEFNIDNTISVNKLPNNSYVCSMMIIDLGKLVIDTFELTDDQKVDYFHEILSTTPKDSKITHIGYQPKENDNEASIVFLKVVETTEKWIKKNKVWKRNQ